MYISYKNHKLQKICTEEKTAQKVLPEKIKPERLFMRLRDLSAFDTMADIPTVPPFRLHKWSGKRNKEWTIDIQDLYRIHFIPIGEYESDHDGNPILNTIDTVEIVDIGDFHRW